MNKKTKFNFITTIAVLLLIVFCAFSCSTIRKKRDVYFVGQIITNHGEMLIWLYDETPRHRDSFITLAKKNYWDSLYFNRVIKDFVIQGGCPDTPEGFGSSPYLIEPEFNKDLEHVYGAVGAGRDRNPGKLSAGCQFYIVHDKNNIKRLNGDYTIFGKVIKGLGVLEKIASVMTDSLDSPIESVPMDVNIIEINSKELRRLGIPYFARTKNP